MEISSLYPQQTMTLDSGVVDDKDAVAHKAAQEALKTLTLTDQTSSGEDLVDLVTNQNLASPASQEIDLTQAQQLLQQVQQNLGGSNRQDLSELYQYDRLREILAQVASVQF